MEPQNLICNNLIAILYDIFSTDFFNITLVESKEKKLFEADVFTIFIEKTTKKSQYSCTVLLLLQILEILESQCTLVVAV